jgi:protein SCO1/2
MNRLGAVAGCFLLVSGAADARIDAGAFNALSFRQHPGTQLPLDAALTDEAGHSVRLAGVFHNRPALVVLEYLRCRNLCGLVLRSAVHSLQSAGLKPGRDVDLVAVSIDPRDTVADATAARKMYAASFADPSAAASGLRFLKGSPEEVARVASAVGFPYPFDNASRQFAHPAGFVVATPQGKISRYILGLNPSPENLRRAIAEANAGDVEPPAHPLLLLCFGYDPDEGTAAALAMRLVRWVSLATILGAALLVAFLSLRRRPA